jgi:hypothetical protein
VTQTLDATDTGIQIYAHGIEREGDVTYDGNLAEWALWGGMLEETDYPTSVIETPSSGTVQRTAESAENAAAASTFNGAEGTFFVEFGALYDTQTNRIISISDGTLNNRIILKYSTGGANYIQTIIDSGGVQSAIITSTDEHDITDFKKIAVTYRLNEFKFFVDGVQIGVTDTSGDVFDEDVLTEISFDDGSGAQDFYGRVKSILYYPEYFSDSEMIKLTT